MQVSLVKVKEIFVVTRSPLAKRWIEQNKKLFAAAVCAHLSESGKNTQRFVREIATIEQDLLDKFNNNKLTTFDSHQNLEHCFNLFPPDPDTKAIKEKSGSDLIRLQIDYKLFSSGWDSLGEWHVDPLGHLVDCVFVLPCRNGNDESRDVKDIDVHVSNDPVDSEKIHDDNFVKVEMHKLYRFVTYHLNISSSSSSLPELANCGYLNREVTKEGLSRAAAKLHTERTFASFESIFNRMTDPTLDDTPRGLLLFGPDRTGTTAVSNALSSDLGMTPIRDGGCFTAGDFSDAFVGGKELKIRTMFERASSCPWLIFCVVIDKIETLVPQRNIKSAESSALGVMLTYLGGLRNVPNFFLFGTTSKRNEIDNAFLRRMSGRIFVGLPSARSRKCWNPIILGSDGKTNVVDTRLIIPTRMESDDSNARNKISPRDALTRLTTNFSSSQMEMVMAELQRFYSYRFQKNPTEQVTVTKEDVFAAVDIVCDRERILFGSRSVPALFESYLSLSTSNNTLAADSGPRQAELEFEFNFSEVFKSRMPDCSGRIFVSLSSVFDSTMSQFELPYLDIQTQDRKTNRIVIHQTTHSSSAEQSESTSSVSPDFFKRLFVQLGVDLDMNAVKLMDDAFFANKGLEDEMDIVCALNEEVSECKQHDRSLMILDLDAARLLVDGNSDAIQRTALFNSMLAIANDSPYCDASKERFFFVVCVTSNSSIASRFHYNLQWPKNAALCSLNVEVSQKSVSAFVVQQDEHNPHSIIGWLKTNSMSNKDLTDKDEDNEISDKGENRQHKLSELRSELLMLQRERTDLISRLSEEEEAGRQYDRVVENRRDIETETCCEEDLVTAIDNLRDHNLELWAIIEEQRLYQGCRSEVGDRFSEDEPSEKTYVLEVEKQMVKHKNCASSITSKAETGITHSVPTTQQSKFEKFY